MRRLFIFLLAFVLSTAAIAGPRDRNPGDDPSDRAGSRGRAVVVQPAQPLTAADRAELAAQGLTLGQPLAGGRFMARLTDGAQIRDTRVSVAPLTAEQKIHRSARAELGKGKTWARLNVIFHEDVTFDDARNAIIAAGGALADPFRVKFSPSQRVEAKFAPASIDALLADERVMIIAGVPRWKVKSDNAASAVLIKVADVQAAPYGLSGAGVSVSLYELGAAQPTHPEFEGRLTVAPHTGASGDRSHATHVAGTIGAAGLDPRAKGMAPKATIYQYCVATGANDCETDWLEEKEDALAPLGIIADNNSWGYVLGWSDGDSFPVWNDASEYWGAYDLIVGAPLDKISNEKGVLFVHSAGNDGDGQTFESGFSEHRHVDGDGDPITNKVFCYSLSGTGNDCPAATCTGGCESIRHDPNTPFDTIGVTAGAKNIITVGAVASNAAGQVIGISGFSSRGPAKDGRVKPEVVARGTSVLSTVPTNGYDRLNGTSMSSPAVTGVAALLTEQWRKTNGGANPTPAQLKALIIAGAEDLGNPGPDYTFGFGLVNAKTSVDTIIADAGKNTRIRNLSVAQGQSIESTVAVAQAQNLRFTLTWPDPPIAYLGGDDIAAKALVNDLDIRVVGPNGEHLPWILDPVAFQNNATRGRNSRDNTEMVDIANAVPGTYRVIVTGTNVAEAPQGAVLVTSVPVVTLSPCRDPQETGSATNDSPETAYGNLVTGQTVSGAICAQGDVDYFKFIATKTGPVAVTVTAGDTAIRATLTGGNDLGIGIDVPANSSRVLETSASSAPRAYTLRIEATGTLGTNPKYTIVPEFGITSAPRRRSAGR